MPWLSSLPHTGLMRFSEEMYIISLIYHEIMLQSLILPEPSVKTSSSFDPNTVPVGIPWPSNSVKMFPCYYE